MVAVCHKIHTSQGNTIVFKLKPLPVKRVFVLYQDGSNIEKLFIKSHISNPNFLNIHMFQTMLLVLVEMSLMVHIMFNIPFLMV